MGNDYVLREQNLMTQLMLKSESTVIQIIQEESLELNIPINQVTLSTHRWAIPYFTTQPTNP